MASYDDSRLPGRFLAYGRPDEKRLGDAGDGDND